MTAFSSIIENDRRELADELAPFLEVLEGSTLLITGSNGFLCSYIIDMVIGLNDLAFRRPCHVIGVDNLQSGIATRTAHLAGRNDYEFIAADASRPLPEMHADWIIHGASIASPTFYRRFPLETIDVNVAGTRNALELARTQKARSFLLLSSSEIYGDPDAAHIPTSEDYRGYVSCTGPRACYDESKRLGETLTSTYFRLFGTPVKTIRPFNVYGPGQRIDDRRIIPDLMSAALERQPLILLSDGRATRAFCYALDFVRALLLILVSDRNGEVFNVGNDEAEMPMRAVADVMSEVAGGEPRLPVQYETSEDPDYLADNPTRRCPDLTKLRTTFDWTPRITLREGLRRTLESYRDLRARGAA